MQSMQGFTGLIMQAEDAPPLPPSATTSCAFDTSVFSSTWAASKRASRCGTPECKNLSDADGLATSAGMVGVQRCLADAIGVCAQAVCKGR
jgi:hypothetical protein